jgi:hypothetical protein
MLPAALTALGAGRQRSRLMALIGSRNRTSRPDFQTLDVTRSCADSIRGEVRTRRLRRGVGRVRPHTSPFAERGSVQTGEGEGKVQLPMPE